MNGIINKKTSSEGINAKELASKFGLTRREEEILRLVSEYKNNDEIAEALNVRQNTIQKHLQNIFRKTNTASKLELIRLCHSEN